MPRALDRLCSGCGARITGRSCAGCRRRLDAAIGTVTARGYGHAWARFRRTFLATLVHQGITPACGATLPGGPRTTHSTCRTVGRLTLNGLHLNHEPPLREAERSDVATVCDPLRIELLCARDHMRITRDQQLERARRPGGV